MLPGAPTIFQTILDHPDRAEYDLSSLRFAVTGAAVVPVALVERMQAELGFDIVLTAFGMTEAVVATMCRRDDPPELVARTCGRAVAGFETRIGEQGELLLRGPNVMLGYLDDPEATAAAIDARRLAAHRRRRHARRRRLPDGSPTGSRTCTSAAASTCTRPRSSRRSPGSTASPSRRSSACPTSGSARSALALVVPGPDATARRRTDVIAFCRERLANYKVPRARRVRRRAAPQPVRQGAEGSAARGLDT